MCDKNDLALLQSLLYICYYWTDYLQIFHNSTETAGSDVFNVDNYISRKELKCNLSDALIFTKQQNANIAWNWKAEIKIPNYATRNKFLAYNNHFLMRAGKIFAITISDWFLPSSLLYRR